MPGFNLILVAAVAVAAIVAGIALAGPETSKHPESYPSAFVLYGTAGPAAVSERGD